MAWVTWRQHRAQLVAGLGLLVALASPRSRTHLPIQAAYHRDALVGLPAAVGALGLRPDRPALPERVRRLGRRPSAGSPCCPALAGLFVGAPLLARELEHGTLPVRLDAGGHPPALAALEDGAARASARSPPACSRARSSMWWRQPVRHARRPDGAERLRHRGARRAGLRALRARARRPRRAAAAAHGRGDDRDARRLRGDAAARRSSSCARTSCAPLHRTVSRPDSGRQVRRLGAQRHARRRRRPADHRRRARTSRSCTRSRRGSTRTRTSSRSAGSALISYQPAGRFWTFQLIEAGLFVALAAAVVVADASGSSAGRRRDRGASTAASAAAARRRRRAAALGASPASAGAGRARRRLFPQPHPRWRFVFVNHALTNPFFVPAKYGSAGRVPRCSACNASGRARVSSDVGEMVKAMERAIAERVPAGSRCRSSTRTRSTARRRCALEHGIPVVAYNADGGEGEQAARLRRPGQLPVRPRVRRADRRASSPSGDVFSSSRRPARQNIQPRVDGALDAIRDSGRPIARARRRERRRRRRGARRRSRRPTARTRACAACSPSTPARPPASPR